MSFSKPSAATLNGRDTCHDFIQRENGNWATGRISMDKLCEQQVPTPEIMVVFLPEVSELGRLRVFDKLSNRFKIPATFWSTAVQEASGHFSCQDIWNADGDLHSFCSQLRLLIKQPAEIIPYASRGYNIKANYIWHHLGVSIHWTPFKNVVVLCFGLPPSLRNSLSNLAELRVDDPFSFYTIFVGDVLALYDKALWSWRDRVRDLEQNRTSPDNPRPNYIMMHEIARHAIHSSETLAMAIETINSLIQEHEIFFEERASFPTEAIRKSKQTSRAFRSQLTLFKCFHLRSKTLEERLRNETNLAFNTVAQRDSRVAIQIGKIAQVDSGAMKAISLLGLVFLPGTFICALFSTSFFNFSPASETKPQHWTVSEKFWIYWVVAIPVTIVTVACWVSWQRGLKRWLADYR
ncbi:hypothetical protein DL98DRAFT_505830 [Cadophora sp. DSE1049]|nr:hypothetical protein DL98DRAFT_505830 [Cadophora sp. DSE1049]